MILIYIAVIKDEVENLFISLCTIFVCSSEHLYVVFNFCLFLRLSLFFRKLGMLNTFFQLVVLIHRSSILFSNLFIF